MNLTDGTQLTPDWGQNEYSIKAAQESLLPSASTLANNTIIKVFGADGIEKVLIVVQGEYMKA